MSQLRAPSGIQSKHLIVMPISEESAFTKPVWCLIAGHFWKRTINNGIPTLFGAPLETLACESEATATARFRSRVSHSPTYASRIFYHCPTTWSYGTPFAGKPRNYPLANPSGSCVLQVWCHRSPAFSLLTPLICCLLGSLSFSLNRLAFFLLSRGVRFLALVFVSFKALDVLMMRSS